MPRKKHRTMSERRTGKPAKINPVHRLSEQHRRMLDYYYGISNLNKSDAMRRAKIGSKDAGSRDLSVFDRPVVKDEMKKREAAFRERYDVTFERVRDEIAKVAFFNPLCVLAIDEETGLVEVDITHAAAHEMAAISEIKVTKSVEGTGKNATVVTKVQVKPWSKTTALDSLMRHAGLSKEKSTFEGANDLVDRILAGRRRASK